MAELGEGGLDSCLRAPGAEGRARTATERLFDDREITIGEEAEVGSGVAEARAGACRLHPKAVQNRKVATGCRLVDGRAASCGAASGTEVQVAACGRRLGIVMDWVGDEVIRIGATADSAWSGREGHKTVGSGREWGACGRGLTVEWLRVMREKAACRRRRQVRTTRHEYDVIGVGDCVRVGVGGAVGSE